MSRKLRNKKWRLRTQSVYVFGREERVQSAYEWALPLEHFEIKIEDKTFQNEISERFQMLRR